MATYALFHLFLILILFFLKVKEYMFRTNRWVSIIVEQKFWTLSCPKNERGVSITVFTSTRHKETGGTASPISTASTGRRPLSSLYLSITAISFLQVPNSNTIYLGIFDSPATVTNLFSSPLAYFQYGKLSQKSDTQHILETWNHTLLADYCTASL